MLNDTSQKISNESQMMENSKRVKKTKIKSSENLTYSIKTYRRQGIYTLPVQNL